MTICLLAPLLLVIEGRVKVNLDVLIRCIFFIILRRHLIDFLKDLLDLNLFWFEAIDDWVAEALSDFLVDIQVEVEVLVFAEVCTAEWDFESVAIHHIKFFPYRNLFQSSNSRVNSDNDRPMHTGIVIYSGRSFSVLLDLEGAVLVREDIAIIAHEQREDLLLFIRVFSTTSIHEDILFSRVPMEITVQEHIFFVFQFLQKLKMHKEKLSRFNGMRI